MATRVVTTLVDDIDGTPIEGVDGETVAFGLDGAQYEIDLTSEHAAALRKLLTPYVEFGRLVNRRASAARRLRNPRAGGVDLTLIRGWARGNGYNVSDRGRIAANVVAAYEAASH